MFLEAKEYQTIWKTAHLWAGISPDETDPLSLPEKVKDLIQQIILGYQRGDLALRTKNRFTISSNEESTFFSIFVVLPLMLKLRKCLIKSVFNKALLDSYYVQRGELLRWCEKEYLPPPSFWAPDESHAPLKPIEIDDADDEKDNWYDTLSDRRKQRVTCLEIAKQLWKENPELSYEEVRTHRAMTRYGYGASFSLGTFKKWARPFASEAAKKGGNKQ